MPPPACAVRREPGAPSRVRLCCGADHAFRRVAVRRVLREGDEQGAALPGQALRGRLDGYGGLSYDEPRDHEIEVRLNDGGVGAGTPTLRRVWVWRAIADRYFARQLDDLCRCAGCTGCAGTPAATPARPPARPPARRSAKARLFREALRRVREIRPEADPQKKMEKERKRKCDVCGDAEENSARRRRESVAPRR